MANIFPSTYPLVQQTGDFTHKASEAAYVGDLAWYDSTNHVLRSANAFTDAGDGPTQISFASVFAGVFNSAQLSTDSTARNARCITDCIVDYTCASNTFNAGDYVTVTYSSGLLAQSLTKTTDPAKAIGRVVKDYTSATTRIKVRLTSKILEGIKRVSATGDGTFDSITGTDSSLGITGIAGASGAGGAIAVTGGAGDGSSNAGGAITVTGGAGGAAGTGGAVSMTGGAPVSGNAVGGAASLVGGAGSGTGAGGATAVTGGASGAGATGNGGAVTVTAGAATSTNGTGGAVTITGGLGTGTGAGGAVSVVSGAAGSTGVAGAIAITVGNATAGNGSSITITGGSGAGGTNSGGNINCVPGAAVSTGTPGEFMIAADAGLIHISEALTATDATRTVFVATRACRFKAVKAVFTTASTSGTLQVEKCTSTTAPGSGTSLLTGTVSLAGTANTVVSGTLISTVASLTLAAGDRLSIVIAGTMTNLVGCRVTLMLSAC